MIEAVVCKADDLKDGEMREVEIGDKKALLVKENGEFYALGSKCTHYGAPLAKGVLCNGRVRCPWHGACFNIKTGDIEDFPGLDSIPKFEVKVTDGKVKICAQKNALGTSRRVKAMVKASDDSDMTYLLVGGGGATITCAEALRQTGFEGKIIITSKDKYTTYDRPKLSKALTVEHSKVALRDADFYGINNIEFRTGKEAVSVDTAAKTVYYKDGEAIKYNKLLLATGAIPRELNQVPGHDLENISTLRTLDDANHIAAQSKGKNVVIVGTSFIGVETACSLVEIAKSVTVVDLVEAPFQLALGAQIGNAVKKLMEGKKKKVPTATLR